ncbi:SDR family oxidoreductase [Marinobacter sp.]|uniref:SDR family oxidoreductase n=1 Tax=Marinobacter sp. TaxID=50741 RepID=UPI002B26947B|nr:SDR family oxidoreductase [Marinobacter sp.]
MSELKVLVTAGAGGIGRAIAEAFSATGALVAVCDIDVEGLKQLERELPDLMTVQCDVADVSSVERMIDQVTEQLGGLDVLINNAGIAGVTAPAGELCLRDWEKVLRVNLTGTFDVTRCALPYLKAAGSGAIVNMSSVAGRFGYPNRIAYSTTKWGLIGFTKTLAIELGEFNITVNAILPGAVDGPRFQSVLEGRAKVSGRTVDEETQAALASQSIKRLVDPRHIADLAVFLASDSGRSISGQMLPIDCDMQHTS